MAYGNPSMAFGKPLKPCGGSPMACAGSPKPIFTRQWVSPRWRNLSRSRQNSCLSPGWPSGSPEAIAGQAEELFRNGIRPRQQSKAVAVTAKGPAPRRGRGASKSSDPRRAPKAPRQWGATVAACRSNMYTESCRSNSTRARLPSARRSTRREERQYAEGI